MAVRFSMQVAGVTIEQEDDGSWHAIESPTTYGFDTVEEMMDVYGHGPQRDTLENMGFAWTGGTVEELIVALVTRTRQYRETIREVTGPPMMPISNQRWCPDADLHLPHVQCAECQR